MLIGEEGGKGAISPQSQGMDLESTVQHEPTNALFAPVRRKSLSGAEYTSRVRLLPSVRAARRA